MRASTSEAAASSAELDEATIAAWTARTRAAKGLPPKVEDPAVIRRIVVLALGPGLPNGGNDDGATPRHQGRDAGPVAIASGGART